jgi:endonuclease IV
VQSVRLKDLRGIKSAGEHGVSLSVHAPYFVNLMPPMGGPDRKRLMDAAL